MSNASAPSETPFENTVYLDSDTFINENISDLFQLLNRYDFGGVFCTARKREKYSKLISKGIDDIYCISVNDAFVMKAWLASYPKGNSIKGIADGNAEFAKEMDLLADYSENFMGNRCKRFALIAENNSIITFNIEEKGQFLVSSAEYILDQL